MVLQLSNLDRYPFKIDMLFYFCLLSYRYGYLLDKVVVPLQQRWTRYLKHECRFFFNSNFSKRNIIHLNQIFFSMGTILIKRCNIMKYYYYDLKNYNDKLLILLKFISFLSARIKYTIFSCFKKAKLIY